MATARHSAACALAALSALAVPASPSDLGTLFHTAEERTRLDQLRRGEPDPVTGAPARTSHEVTGFVRRSDGRATVWINGVPVVVAGPAAKELLDPSKMRGSRREGVKVERTAEPQVKR